MKQVLAACALISLSTPIAAQETYYWPAAPQNTPTSRYLNFPAGTPVSLVTRADISTKQVHAGDRVWLSVAEPIYYNGQVVLPVGAPVAAEVAQADRNGHFGVKGKLAIRLLHVQTPMGPVQLTGASTRTGRSGTALSIGTIVFVSVLGGFLIHGTSAKIPYGTSVQGYLAEPLKFWGSRDQTVAALEAAPRAVGARPGAVVALAH